MRRGAFFRLMFRPQVLVGASLCCVVLGSAFCGAIALVLGAAYGTRSTGDGRTLAKAYRAEARSGALAPLSYGDYERVRARLVGLADVEAAQRQFASVDLGDRHMLIEAQWTTAPEPFHEVALARGSCNGNGSSSCFIISDSVWRDLDRPADFTLLSARLEGKPIQVSAVAASGFRGSELDERISLWIIGVAPDEAVSRPGGWDVSVRLQKGVTLEDLTKAMAPLEGSQILFRPDTYGGFSRTPGNPLAMRPELLALYLAILASMVNVYALTAAALHRRRRELALCALMGASQRRLWYEHFRYSVFVGIVGGGGGCLAAYWLARAAANAWLPDAALGTLIPSMQQCLLTMALAIVTVSAGGARVLAGLNRPAALSAASSAHRSITKSTKPLSAALQIGIMCAMGLATLVAIQSTDNIVDARRSVVGPGVSVVELTHPSGWGNEAAGRFAFGRFLRSISPNRVAALATVLPFGRGTWERFRTDSASERYIEVETNIVTAAYFDAVRIPMVEGRTFSAADSARAPVVAVVNDVLAARYFDGDAVGRTLTSSGGEDVRIVGVVGMSNYPVASKPQPMLFRSLSQRYSPKLFAVARDSGGGAVDLEGMRLAATEAKISVTRAGLLDQFLGDSLVLERLSALVVGAASIGSVVIGLLGIYVVLVDTVTERRREISVRLALGSPRTRVFVSVMALAALTLAIGLGVGTMAGFVGYRIAQSLVFGISQISAMKATLLLAALSGSGLAVAAFPAWRAAQVDPAEFLMRD